MKIAVIGAGIFGMTAAFRLREAGHDVTVFERNSTILSEASRANQYRLHRGYHYPRSNETVDQIINSVEEFQKYYSASIVEDIDRYYAIARNRSLISPTQYLEFLNDVALEYEHIPNDGLDILKPESIDLLVKVKETSFDAGDLYLQFVAMVLSLGIKMKFNREFKKSDIDNFDVTVNCTYQNINHLLPEEQRIEYQFELCEKPVVSLNEKFQKKSVVIMDGPFGCIDPKGRDKYFHLLGHVEEAIHDRQIGHFYEPKIFGGDGIHDLGRCNRIVEALREFFVIDGVPTIPIPPKRTQTIYGREGYYYNGSYFVVRTVLPNRDHDDARPSYITKHADNLYSIFSGKIGTAVTIADELTKMI